MNASLRTPSSLRASLFAFGAGLALLFSSAPAEAAFQVAGKAKVSFYAKGSPGALDIEGKTESLSLTDDGTTLTFTVPFDSLSTGIDMRDTHMKDKYLHVGQFPTATLSFARALLTLPVDVGSSTNGTLQATFTAHGVAQPVTVTWTLKRSKTGYAVDAGFNYNASSHGIEIPSYLGVTVDPAQNARVKFDMVDI